MHPRPAVNPRLLALLGVVAVAVLVPLAGASAGPVLSDSARHDPAHPDPVRHDDAKRPAGAPPSTAPSPSPPTAPSGASSRPQDKPGAPTNPGPGAKNEEQARETLVDDRDGSSRGVCVIDESSAANRNAAVSCPGPVTPTTTAPLAMVSMVSSSAGTAARCCSRVRRAGKMFTRTMVMIVPATAGSSPSRVANPSL